MLNRINRSHGCWYESLVGIRSWAECFLFVFQVTKVLEPWPDAIVANINLKRSWASCLMKIQLPLSLNGHNSVGKKERVKGIKKKEAWPAWVSG